MRSKRITGRQAYDFLAPPSGDTITVNPPANLTAGVQTVTGTESNPRQPVYLDWHRTGTPALNARDRVQATVASNGSFSAWLDIDHPGVKSTTPS